MMIILLLMLIMALFIMKGGYDNESGIGNNTHLLAFIMKKEREIGNEDNKSNCRCVLLGKMFVYFRNPNEQNPVGQLNMRDSRVEEVVTSFSCLF